MFLHMGKDVVVPLKEVISIINLTKEPSLLNCEFLRTAEEEGFVVQLGSNPISCIICSSKIYLSPISVHTLNKRARVGYLTRLESEYKES